VLERHAAAPGAQAFVQHDAVPAATLHTEQVEVVQVGQLLAMAVQV
jgi:hypothetical protein